MSQGGPRQLDEPLTKIYKNVGLAEGPLLQGTFRQNELVVLLKPNDSYDPTYRTIMTAVQGSLPAVEFLMIGRLTTIIAQAKFGNGSSVDDLFKDVKVGNTTFPGQMTIRQFMGLPPPTQMDVINLGWERVCESRAYSTATADMFDPIGANIAATSDPVPSGMIPNPAGGYKLGAEARPTPFKTLGVGFRVEGSGANRSRDIDRVKSEGMKAQVKNTGLMRDIKGWGIDGTIVQTNTSCARFWRTKNDIFNESAVCVSRNLYGATGFPERNTGDGEPVTAVLWAVDCYLNRGFDTEQLQLDLGTRNWRPGEKAYESIPRSDVIGYVEILRTGSAPGGHGGWTFRIPNDAKWTYLPGWEPPFMTTTNKSRESRARDYIEEQLKAWRGADHTIANEFDFNTA